MSPSWLPFAAALACGLIVAASLLKRRQSIATWSFAFGMGLLALESLLAGLGLEADGAQEAMRWQRGGLIVRSALPLFWLLFSLTYSRGNYRQFLRRWRIGLALALFLPVVAATGSRFGIISTGKSDASMLIFNGSGRALVALLLVAEVLVLTNLEKTFRAAVGTMRWRIKFVVLGLGIIFGARIYSHSQALLFSRYDPSLATVEGAALIVGCIFIAIAYFRTGLEESDVYPSRAVLERSFTIMVAGGYLFVVGVLAQIVAAMGGGRYFELQALVILVGIASLATLLLSDRFRQETQRLISRNFKRPEHDFQRVWTLFTERLGHVVDEEELTAIGARLISETFEVLSVTVWLLDGAEHLICSASTAEKSTGAKVPGGILQSADLAEGLLRKARPFDLEESREPWAETLRENTTSHFAQGGRRMAVPLISGKQTLGVVVLADRVRGRVFTTEEWDLLKCIGDQLAASLLRVRLSGEIVRARELEAFQTVSAFFVHDLKNAASSLGLTLKNLPIHFNDPEFRQDALRAITSTLERINSVTSKLGVLRGKLEVVPTEFELNEFVKETVAGLSGLADTPLALDLNPVPLVRADREGLRSVLTNLLLNAHDAVAHGGEVKVETQAAGRNAVLVVSDTGCGMSADFLNRQLFRPFQTTKTNGIGIGMFQTRAIIEAHGGTMQVRSELGKGSTFRVLLPNTPPAQ